MGAKQTLLYKNFSEHAIGRGTPRDPIFKAPDSKGGGTGLKALLCNLKVERCPCGKFQISGSNCVDAYTGRTCTHADSHLYYKYIKQKDVASLELTIPSVNL